MKTGEVLKIPVIEVSDLKKIKGSSKFSGKTNISNPLIRTRTCAYQGVRKVSFSENFYVRTKWMAPYGKTQLSHDDEFFAYGTSMEVTNGFIYCIIHYILNFLVSL